MALSNSAEGHRVLLLLFLTIGKDHLATGSGEEMYRAVSLQIANTRLLIRQQVDTL